MLWCSDGEGFDKVVSGSKSKTDSCLLPLLVVCLPKTVEYLGRNSAQPN